MDSDPKDKYKDKGRYWGMDYSKDTDITIEIHMDIPKIDQEELKKFNKLIEKEIIRSFTFSLDQMAFGGMLPIKQNEKTTQRPVVKSCICCKYWKIETEKTYLTGVCLQKGKERTDYGFVCELWEECRFAQF